MSRRTLLETLKAIHSAQGRKEKIEVLRAESDNDDVRLYFKYALSPYINWGVSSVSIQEAGSKEHWDASDKLFLSEASTKYTPIKEYRDWLEQFTKQFQKFMIGMLTKKPRLGVSEETIQNVMPGLWKEFKVPLAHPVEWDKVKFPCLAQVKIDGLRCIYDHGKFYSRRGNIIQGLDDIGQVLKSLPISEFKIDGEIWAPGKSFDEISGKIRSFDKVKDAHYYIFDIDMYEPYRIRHALLLHHCVQWLNNGVTKISVPHSQAVHNREEALKFFDEAIINGFEGAVLKDLNAIPFTGRKWYWQKIKSIDTIDLKVMKLEEGQGKYKNMVGALVANYRGTEVRIGTGLTDQQRKRWWDFPSLIIGATIEIAFMENSSKGSLRHPRLISVRGDK